MKNTDEVAIFWDYENCSAPTNTSGYAIVNSILSVVQAFGSIKLFKAYLEVTEQIPASRAQTLRSELQSSGVSLTDCPHNGRKDVADKMILVDMLAHAIDNPAPSTIVLISGDRDFAYALSILRLRRYRIVLITLSNAHQSLRAQASLCFDWISDILEPVDATLSHQPTSPRRGKTSSFPAHDRPYSESKSHNLSRFSFQESYDEKSASSVEFMKCSQDATRRSEYSRTPARHELLSSNLERPNRQPTISSMASGALNNGPEFPARFLYSPVASSYYPCLNGDIETPLFACGFNPLRTKLPSNTSAKNTSRLATFGSITPRSSADSTWQGSPYLRQHEFGNLTEPVSLDSAIRMLHAEPDLRGSFPSSQQGLHPLFNAKTQSLNINQMTDNNPAPPPVPSHISTPPNLPKPISPIIPPSFLSNAVVTDVSHGSVNAANPLQPTSSPVVPDEFQILVQCLKSYRSRGILRASRSKVAVEIAQNGITYLQAGVLRFGEYAAMAEKAGIIELGGSQATAWIGLKAPWCDAPSF